LVFLIYYFNVRMADEEEFNIIVEEENIDWEGILLLLE
jgi:hypothetical protein